MNESRFLQIKPLVLTQAQRDFYLSNARFIAVDSGRRAGKTTIAMRKLARACLCKHPQTPNPWYIYGLPSWPQANKVWGELLRMFGPLVEWKLKGEHCIQLVTGARIYLTAMCSPQFTEGSGYAGAILDEMCDILPQTFEESILPAISDLRGFCYCMGVPKRRGPGASYFHELCKRWEGVASPNFQRFSWTSEGILSEKALEEAQATTDEVTFREQYLASWENTIGVVYYSFDRNTHIVSEDMYDPLAPLLIGSDFNRSPMSWVICQGDARELRVIDEIRLYDSNTPEALNELWRRYHHHIGGFRFYGDAAGRNGNTVTTTTDYDLIFTDSRFKSPFGDSNVFYPKSNPAVLDRVVRVNSMLRNVHGLSRIKIHERCKYLIKDMQYVTFKEGTSDLDKTNKELTHMSDALGYLVYIIAPVGVEYVENEARIIT